MFSLLLIIGVILVITMVFAVTVYNTVIGRKNDVENSFATIDAYLKKRYDLIPNLVETVKTYMQYEESVLIKITELRTGMINKDLNINNRMEASNEISKLLGGITAVLENYPDLKANNSFIELQKTMSQIEDELAAARRTYNASVTEFNNALEMFPTNIVAAFLKYQRKEVLSIGESERKNINIKNLFNSK
ncbi:MAG: LemA family protein [Oligoflexia bacterium]|nr:LemA family protein [Oligoflexia bacterium]